MIRKSERTALLLSGGIDSAILLHRLLQKKCTVYPVYIQSHYLWEHAELYWLKKLLHRLKSSAYLKSLTVLKTRMDDVLKHSWAINGKAVPGRSSRDEAVYLPGRNLLLIAKVSVFAAQNRISQIALAPLASNPFPDATHRFFRHYAKTLSLAFNTDFTIKTPFRTNRKYRLLQSVPYFPFELTFSCLHPKSYRHCGRCNKCMERKRAFRRSGLEDKTIYAG
ncbi:MAG: 7-cyano-7-deazaguanine synthase [Candidatus Omnitrophica bacterium CG11_big_fil_rev_8_21_14_0_20_45_26]|uniref:7-cyano-7-deazaguanine synthase n=1 Tax=Candidatus Abzuiibacterium crystallinum TaxID=1974748 RepID=A0A2H0LKU4_9BACT|nr:MAG: 7-cyano-7-deazaguanine synthase [Candidatus Omnitrophica bacterium CG11_big_fil_rev_8_21_14_0_20_45_26]PIW63883.1 MAG: 7-cyano-7-deazaguanine synthase [Candidatus Omnitrophica bacterium CG12_big_fil_rev_8_21_14_0_65_45_16]